MTQTPLTRADLQKVFGDNPKVIFAFEQLAAQVATNTDGVTAQVAATGALQDATVITLSPNDTFTNERVLAVDPAAFSLTDNGPGNTLVLALLNLITLNGSYACAFNLLADTNLNLPVTGTVPSSDIGPYADDAAAAAAGVAVGEWYAKTGGTVAWRVS